jgi:hypothetical protein
VRRDEVIALAFYSQYLMMLLFGRGNKGKIGLNTTLPLFREGGETEFFQDVGQ